MMKGTSGYNHWWMDYRMNTFAFVPLQVNPCRAMIFRGHLIPAPSASTWSIEFTSKINQLCVVRFRQFQAVSQLSDPKVLLGRIPQRFIRLPNANQGRDRADDTHVSNCLPLGRLVASM